MASRLFQYNGTEWLLETHVMRDMWGKVHEHTFISNVLSQLDGRNLAPIGAEISTFLVQAASAEAALDQIETVIKDGKLVEWVPTSS